MLSAERRRRIRVVQAILDLEAGGLERVVADLVRRLDPERFEVHVVALRFLGRHAQGLEQYATLHTAPRLGPSTMLWPRPLQALLRSIGPDVLHSHSGAWYKSSLAARISGIKSVVHTEHGRPEHDPWFGRLLEYLASRRTDVLITVSPDLGIKMKRVIAPRCEIAVIPNGVDTDVFVPGQPAAAWRDRLGLSPGTPVIGCVSRLDPIKDFAMLLRALHALRQNWSGGEPPVLAIAGDGPEREHIEELTTQLGLKGAVHMLGWIGETRDLYSLFDVFTLSSRSEGTSIALLEAMSCSVCPVVTAVGGNPAVLGPDLASLLVPSGAADALAQTWRAVLTARDQRAGYGTLARQRVIDQFSLNGMVSRHEALYERLSS